MKKATSRCSTKRFAFSHAMPMSSPEWSIELARKPDWNSCVSHVATLVSQGVCGQKLGVSLAWKHSVSRDTQPNNVP